ncbi:SUMF1/EgtB/PvdO family nonheme iron enzyme [Sorangium sp. So ce315]|uniref:SUMF1/EgtB/PvdO family nonheme iron enzyme n=1 Tax=Sorangium sp. So ce315 TaxID=3133299 RepID=UPI003F62EF8F
MQPEPVRRVRPDRVSRLLDAFRARFGPAHELFACHAAFPAALTPELAYQLWAAFRADVRGQPLGVPWIAVADLLLSSLCAEIGEELYEMAPDVRAALRRRLTEDPRLGPQRVQELSGFLIDAAAAALHAEDAYDRTLAQTQRLTALAYGAPERTAALLVGMLAEVGADDLASWIRLASLIDGLAEPLAEFPLLLQFAQAMAAWGRGEPRPLAAFVAAHGPATEVAGVRLAVPVPVEAIADRVDRGPETVLAGAVGPAPVAPSRGLRVLVAGTGSLPSLPLHDVTTWAAEALGEALADAGHGLLTGGYPGVDEVTARAFAAQVERLGRPVEERLEQVVRRGMRPVFRGGRTIEVAASPPEGWADEVLRRCDALVIAGGAELVAELATAAQERGKPVISLPWTGGASQRIAEAIRELPPDLDAPVATQARALRLLEGGPRFQSDTRALVDRAMAVLALHNPAARRDYSQFALGMANLVGILGVQVFASLPIESSRVDASLPSLLYMTELLTAAGVDTVPALASAAPASAFQQALQDELQRIEATLPAMAPWLVEDWLTLHGEAGWVARERALAVLTPLLARHAQPLARAVIGRAFDGGAGSTASVPELDPAYLAWIQETRNVLGSDEHQRWVQDIAVRWAEACLAEPSPMEGDRIAQGIERALRAAELAPRLDLVLPLLAADHAAVRVAGYLVCRACRLPVSAEALDACLQRERLEMEGAASALRQLLTCYETLPGLDQGAAARRAVAGLVLTARLLDTQQRSDANRGCRKRVFALLEGRFKAAWTLLDRLEASARRYEEIRRTMPGGKQRTAQLDILVHGICETLRSAGLTPEELSERFNAGGDGDRIVALAGVFVTPDAACFELVRRCIDRACSDFEQFWAMRAAEAMLPALDGAPLGALRAALEYEMSGAPGARMKETSVSRRSLAHELLRRIQEMLGAGQGGLAISTRRSARRLTLDMVFIPPGRFSMGSEAKEPGALDDQRPCREVVIGAFEMARVPVTQRQYREVTGKNPSTIEGDELPVIDVSWEDAIRFCNALSERDGLTPAYRLEGGEVQWDRGADGYRLPTEAEWEYAARGHDGRIYPWGDALPYDQLCWSGHHDDALGRGKRAGPSPVGIYPSGASPFGLLDMAGNVLEWCWDRHGPYRKTTAPDVNPTGPAEGEARVLRGGSWFSMRPAHVRVVYRARHEPSRRDDRVGFRCARGRVG